MVDISCRGKVFRNIQAIIFDKDGTLADSQAFWQELAVKRAKFISKRYLLNQCQNKDNKSLLPSEPFSGLEEALLLAFGVKDDRLDPASLMAVGSRMENEIGAAAYLAAMGKSWFEAKDIVAKAFQEADRSCDDRSIPPLFAGVISLLESLYQKGLKLGILSADTTAGVENFVKDRRLEPYIRLKMGSDREYSKPDPALFLEACKQLGVEPSQTIMVGDARGDIDMAKRAGAAGTIAICWDNDSLGTIEGMDVTIDRLDRIICG
jgi:phosphoglycolate phosphatase